VRCPRRGARTKWESFGLEKRGSAVLSHDRAQSRQVVRSADDAAEAGCAYEVEGGLDDGREAGAEDNVQALHRLWLVSRTLLKNDSI
jgi:hypothetical protein